MFWHLNHFFDKLFYTALGNWARTWRRVTLPRRRRGLFTQIRCTFGAVMVE